MPFSLLRFPSHFSGSIDLSLHMQGSISITECCTVLKSSSWPSSSVSCPLMSSAFPTTTTAMEGLMGAKTSMGLTKSSLLSLQRRQIGRDYQHHDQ